MSITAEQLLDCAVEIATKWPEARITHNPVRGLAIDVGDEFVGWLDTNTGTIQPPKGSTT